MQTTQHTYGGVDYVVVDLGCLVYFATSQALPTASGGVAAIRVTGSTRRDVHAQVRTEIRNLPSHIRDRLPLVH